MPHFVINIPGPNLQVRAHHCYVGRERDANNQWLWVLPYEDPCLCTSIRLGGMNIDTPERHFNPVYKLAPWVSEDLQAIRLYYGLECKGKMDSEVLSHRLIISSRSTGLLVL